MSPGGFLREEGAELSYFAQIKKMYFLISRKIRNFMWLKLMIMNDSAQNALMRAAGGRSLALQTGLQSSRAQAAAGSRIAAKSPGFLWVGSGIRLSAARFPRRLPIIFRIIFVRSRREAHRDGAPERHFWVLRAWGRTGFRNSSGGSGRESR